LNGERRTWKAPDDDLSRLSAEDLARVCRWVEDRMINAITPLDVRLQLEMPGTMAADPTLQTARKAVQRVMTAVGELRALARRAGMGGRQ
jgi:hypothetical protein